MDDDDDDDDGGNNDDGVGGVVAKGMNSGLPFAPLRTKPNPSFSFLCSTTVFSSMAQSLRRKLRTYRPLLHPIILIMATALRPECMFIMMEGKGGWTGGMEKMGG